MKGVLSIWLGKSIHSLLRTFRIGGGSAAPGLYALKISPELISKLSAQIPINIAITGTNGKTTTARILSLLLQQQNLTVLGNSTGSNLERGIASTLISRANLFGTIEKIDMGVWEVDEAVFNTVIPKIKPDLIVFLNCFRDQLDRYGEVDTVIEGWKKTLKKAHWKPTILVNESDNNTRELLSTKGLRSFGFRVKNHSLWQEKRVQAAKFRDDFIVESFKNTGLSGTNFSIKTPAGSIKGTFPIPGVYHLYDLTAALGIYYLLNQPLKGVNKVLESYTPAFGRVEQVKLGGKEAYIFLIKNPAGTNSVLETIKSELKPSDRLLVALNDNFADGTDVSWIWDSSWELLANNKQIPITCSGNRAEDMALRLKYAEVDPKKIQIENSLINALNLAQMGLKGRLFILPTYTALLELQKILAKKGIKKHYWRDSLV